MTARMVRFDDEYITEFDKIVRSSGGHIEVVDDPNLKYDPYFYERKASLDKTIQAVDDGSMKMLSQEEYDKEMDIFMIEQEKKYADN